MTRRFLARSPRATARSMRCQASSQLMRSNRVLPKMSASSKTSMACRSKAMVKRELGKAQGTLTRRMPWSGQASRGVGGGAVGVEQGPKAAVIEMPPAPGGDMIIDRGPATTFGTAEGRVASMGEPDVDALLVGVEGDGIDPPGARQVQEPGEELGVEHG